MTGYRNGTVFTPKKERAVKEYSFMKAVALMKEGKKVKRKDWFGFLSINDDYFVHHMNINDCGDSFIIGVKSIEANDWIVVDE